MTVLVTGGGGFLGSRIVERLLARGDRVRTFGRRRYPALAQLGADCVVGDLRDAAALSQAADGCDVVFHTAALAGVWGPRAALFETNVVGTTHVIAACRARRVPSLVYTSSPSVAIGEDDIENGDESLPYPDRYLAPYPATKAEAERAVLAANGTAGTDGRCGRRPSALRPHLIWGPRDPHLVPRLVAAARAGRLTRVGDGRNRVDITYIDNAAHAHLLAADALRGDGRPAGNAYFIGDAEPVVLWDWIAGLLSRLGVPAPRRALSYPAARRLGAVLEAVHTALPFLGEPRLTRFVAAQLSASHWFSHARARRDFGYQPIVDGATGLDRLVEWLGQGTAPGP